jgi:ribosomal-protein-alanine N-acetyltransferase
MNLAVRPDFRRMGVASQLMLGMNEVSAEWQCRRMKLEVRSSNRDARDFYSSLGFSYVTRLKGYYSGVEDALVLVARLPIVID